VFEEENLAAGSVFRKRLLASRGLGTMLEEDTVHHLIGFESQDGFSRKVTVQKRGRKGKDEKNLERLTKRWELKRRFPFDFYIRRNSDNAIVLFKCDVCIFRKLRKTSPDLTHPDYCMHPKDECGCRFGKGISNGHCKPTPVVV
jgi:hypothetical protein